MITCEHFVRPDGWYFEEEDGEIPADDDSDILEQITESKTGRSWCGSYSYQLTFDEFFSEGRQYYCYPERKVIWEREWRQFLISEQGEWFFDVFTYLEWLGEDWLRQGKIPNFNPIAKEILDGLKGKMKNEYSSDDSIVADIKLYNEVILDSLMKFEHGTEYVFGQWALYHMIWQLSQTQNIPAKRKNWTRPAATEREKYCKMLYEMGGERWMDIESLISARQKYTEKESVSVDDMNRNIIDGIWNSLDAGFDEALNYVKLLYGNDGGNDFFIKSRAELEKALFRLLLYSAFLQASDTDVKKFVADDEYYSGIRRGLFESGNGEDVWKMIHMGEKYVREGKPGEAFELLKKTSLKGNARGMYLYSEMISGHAYEGRIFGDIDVYLESAFWYWLAGTLGDAEAMNNLAYCYYKGEGVRKNKNLMLYWMVRGAALFYPQAIYNVGVALEREDILSGQDLRCFAAIFKRAANTVECNDRAQMFVKNNTDVLMQIIKEQSILYNIF